LARKILLADDSVTAQNMGRKILADAGYEVITVNNGSAALKRIAEHRPDLIVLDVYMPGYSGLEVCQRLKETGETACIPVLLTVGKLEPFKPEEAKRARADAFIVKPFEASELLSALTKLEDKIVPRAENSKPGRFARSIAAIEEGRYDRTTAGDQDAGWKSRISFPSGKKGKAAEPENGNEGAIYNPVNKDLRTVVEPQPSPAPQESQAAEARVDLGALAGQGLPKDVTPEEIAALAAAAAQVQGSLASSRGGEAAAEIPAATTAISQSVVAEVKIEKQAEGSAEIRLASASDLAQAEFTTREGKTEETRSEETTVETAKIEAAKIEAAKIETAKIESATAIEGAATGKQEEKVETPTTVANEAERQAAASAAMSPAELVAGTGRPEWASHGVATDTSSGNGAGWNGVDRRAEEPVTMAVAAGAESTRSGSHWSAVAVALAPEEAAISLENEMQKVFAAFAAADGGQPAAGSALSEAETPGRGTIEPEGASRPEATSEPVAAASLSSTPEAESFEAASAVGAAISNSVVDAVGQLEATAAAYLGQAGVEQAGVEQAGVEQAGVERAVVEPAAASLPADQARASAKLEEDQPFAEKSQAAERVEAVAVAAAETEESHGGSAENPDVPAEAIRSEGSGEEIPAAALRETVEPAAEAKAGNDGIKEAARTESDIAATTAAAWASWRRIRESGDAGSDAKKDEEAISQDVAAMAVAAGAEKTPREAVPGAQASDPDAIASIVDSVLADLRPKIVEEISRKMGKKNKKL
jgi:CheY-like chemotaxis protein